MFGIGEPKNYASIVAPLKKMAQDLTDYVAAQRDKITGLEEEKAQIEADIQLSESEILKSNFTTTKINDLLGSDLDEDGIADVEELPVTEDPVDDSTPTDETDTQQ